MLVPCIFAPLPTDSEVKLQGAGDQRIEKLASTIDLHSVKFERIWDFWILRIFAKIKV